MELKTSNNQYPHLLIILAAILLAQGASSAPLSSDEVEAWLRGNVIPEKGEGTFQDEMKCYSIPYGSLGFVSHLLTMWTFWMLAVGKRPYWPWRPLSHGLTDVFLALTGLLLSVAVAAFTMYRCKNGWSFVLLGFWKLILSFTLGGYSLEHSILLR